MIHSDFNEDEERPRARITLDIRSAMKDLKKLKFNLFLLRIKLYFHNREITWKEILFFSGLIGVMLWFVILFAQSIDDLQWLWWTIFGVAVILLAIRFIRTKIFNK